MPRLTNLDDVLFAVEEHPIYVRANGSRPIRNLPVPGKRALVNTENDRVLGIVGHNYRLVPNREALELARSCCRTVFPETKDVEWEVRTVDAPSTAGHCRIDLAHNSTLLDFSVVPPDQRDDIFGPFIRVTNSYNALHALRFDIGFYRKVCKNGLIAPDTIITFKFTHSRRDIGDTIDFEVAHDKLAEFKARFTDSVAGLRSCEIPRPHFVPIVCGALSIRPPKKLEPKTPEAEDWTNLGVHLEEMSGRYAKELGESAYAVFNTITEFASHPPENRCLHRDRHSLQRLAGTWLTTFAPRCRLSDFSLSDYMEELGQPPVATTSN